MNTTTMSNILIIGMIHHNTIGLVESLALKGIKPDLIVFHSSGTSFFEHSKNYHNLYKCDTEEELVKCMLEHYSNKEAKTIVISSADIASVYLDRHYDELKEFFYLPLPTFHGQLEHMMSKEYMRQLAGKVGITTPKTITIHDNNIPDGVEYPCLTKAEDSIEGTKEDLHICQNEEELRIVLENTEHCRTLLIQKFIKKEFEFQLLGCSLNNGEEIVISGRTNIVRTKGIDNTYFLSFDKCEECFNDLIGKAKQFIKETTYNGPFSMEFLHGADGNDYFMELNFRNDGNSYCQTAAGINIPYIIYLYYNGLDYKSEIEKSKIYKVYLIPDYDYAYMWAHGVVGTKEFITNQFKATCHTHYYPQDKRITFYYVYDWIKVHVKSALHIN